MTQKELAYIEDAIGHENNIISILDNMIDSINDDDLVSYMNEEITNHQDMLSQLIELLEVEDDEWTINIW